MNSPCGDCGLADLHAASGSIRCVALPQPPAADVYVVLKGIQMDDFSAEFYSTPRVRFMSWALQAALGWTAEQVRQRVAWSFDARCPGHLDKPVGVTEKRLCSDFIKADIQRLKPKVVILGGYQLWGPLHSVRSKGQVHGRLVPVDSLAYRDGTTVQHEMHWLTLEDPQTYLVNEDSAHCREILFAELQLVALALSGKVPKTPFEGKDYGYARTSEEAHAILDYYLQRTEVAWDIETGGAPHATDPYHPDFRIIGISLSSAPHTGRFVPLWHPQLNLAEQDPTIVSKVEKLLTTPGIYRMAHNGINFDAHAWRVKYGVDAQVSCDTMLLDGEYQENRSHRLKDLAVLVAPEMAHYDDYLPFTGRKKAIYDFGKDIELGQLASYACADADVTYRLAYYLIPRLTAVPNEVYGHQFGAAISHRHRVARTVTAISEHGLQLEPERVKAFQSWAQEQVDETQGRIREHAWVRAYEAEQAAKAAANGFFQEGRYVYHSYEAYVNGVRPVYDTETNTELVSGVREWLVASKKASSKGVIYKKYLYGEAAFRFNISSSAQVGALFAANGVSSGKKTKKGGISWDDEVLKTLSVREPLARAILDYRAATKILNTYARAMVCGEYSYQTPSGSTRKNFGWVRHDGLVHPTFLLVGNDRGQASKKDEGGGTATKRLSTKDPNSQNFAKHSKAGKRLYSIFVPKGYDPRYPFAASPQHAQAIYDGMSDSERSKVVEFVYAGQSGSWCILQVDYSQLELRLCAILIGCTWMLTRYQNDADLHSDLAMEAFQATLEAVLADGKLLRAAAKKLWFGPIYGQGYKGLYIEILKEMIDRGVPERAPSEEEVRLLLNRLKGRMPEYDPYVDAVTSVLSQHEAIYSWAGTRRFLPSIKSPDEKTRSRTVRQAVNFTIQSLGAECTNWSFCELHEQLFRQGFRSRIVNTVHDSIVFQCPSEEVLEVFLLASRVMSKPPFPRLANAPIPLVCEGELGPSWGEMAEIVSTDPWEFKA